MRGISAARWISFSVLQLNLHNKTVNKPTRIPFIATFNPSLQHYRSPSDEPPSPLIFWVHCFPSGFINRTIFFPNALESHECTCSLLIDVRQYYSHFPIFIGSFLYQRAIPSQGTVLFINLLGKGSNPRASMGNKGSIWWAPELYHSSLDWWKPKLDNNTLKATTPWYVKLFLTDIQKTFGKLN